LGNAEFQSHSNQENVEFMLSSKDYVTRIHRSLQCIDAKQWNALLAQSDASSPFMRHEYLAAMQSSGSAVPETGWDARFIALYAEDGQELLAACPLYIKTHSYGEYVFDWAWARAYQEHGLAYYPKAVVAVPFTPVPGSRFLCKNGISPSVLLREVLSFCEQEDVSSLHALFASDADQALTQDAKLMLRETVQFHWSNSGFKGFDAFLATLSQDKRKKIRAERRKVTEAGVTWRWSRGPDIRDADWDFFYACYERTYLEHGNPPYLTREFFQSMQTDMSENWLLFIAERAGRSIACSLIAIQDGRDAINSIVPRADSMKVASQKPSEKVAYGRYWGAIERVDSLHFEACYYQPLQWCIENGFDRFEGGAQGEHKMARGLLPVVTRSAHWLAHPQFADAVNRFLDREKNGIGEYVQHLQARTPYRAGTKVLALDPDG
jgi:predicted N-acyltransferase